MNRADGTPAGRGASNRSRCAARPLPGGSRGPVKSADRSLALLELLAGRPEGLSFAEIAGALALPAAAPTGCCRPSRRGATSRRKRARGGSVATAWACAWRSWGRRSSAGGGGGCWSGQGRPWGSWRRAAGGRASGGAGRPGDALPARRGGGATCASPPRRAAPPPAHAMAEGRCSLAGSGHGGRPALPGRRACPTPCPASRRARSTPSRPCWPAARGAGPGRAHDVGSTPRACDCVAAPWWTVRGRRRGAQLPAPPAADAKRLVQPGGLVRRRPGASPRSAPPGALPGAAGPARACAWPGAWPRAGAVFGEIGRVAEQIAPALGAGLVRANAQLDQDRQVWECAPPARPSTQVLVLHPVTPSAPTPSSGRLRRRACPPSAPGARPAATPSSSSPGRLVQEGVLQIEWVAGRLGGRGNVVILEGDPYNDNARNIAEGNRHALSLHPGLRLVADEVCPDWSGEVARRLAGEVLDRLESPATLWMPAGSARRGVRQRRHGQRGGRDAGGAGPHRASAPGRRDGTRPRGGVARREP